MTKKQKRTRWRGYCGLGILILVLMSFVYMPCFDHLQEKHGDDQNKDTQKCLDELKSAIVILANRYQDSESQQARIQKSDIKGGQLKPLESLPKDISMVSQDHLLLNQTRVGAVDESSALTAYVRECVDRIEGSAAQVDDLSWRFIVFILSAGTLLVAVSAVWIWHKKQEFQADYQSNLDDLRKQGKEQMSEVQKDTVQEIAHARCLALSLVGDMLSQRNLKNYAHEKYEQALTILDEVLKNVSNQTLLHEKTIMLNKLGDIRSEYGDFDQAMARYKQSSECSKTLVKDASNHVGWQRDLILSLRKRGDTAMKQGNLKQARQFYERSIKRIEQVPMEGQGFRGVQQAHDQHELLLQHDKNIALRKLGEIHKTQGDLQKAVECFEKAFTIADRLIKADVTHVKWQRDVMLSRVGLADVFMARGNLMMSFNICIEAEKEARRLLMQEPENTERLCDLGEVLERMVPIRKKRGELDVAYASSKEWMEIVEHLVKQDSYNMEWQKKRIVALGYMGDVLQDRGDFKTAGDQYSLALSSAERLVDKYGSSVQWQRDLSVCLKDVGIFLVVRNQGTDVREVETLFRRSLEIAKGLVEKDVGNSQWQRDLSISLNCLGAFLEFRGEDGDVLEAEALFRRSIEIVEELAKKDVGNAQWQRDLSISLDHLGALLQARGEDGDVLNAEALFRRGLEIREELVKKDVDNAQWHRDVSISLDNLGKLLQSRGEEGDVLKAEALLRHSLEIAEELAKKDVGNLQWQRDLSISLENLGALLQSRGEESDVLNAEALLRRSLEIREELAKKDVGNAQWQRDLSISLDNLGAWRHARGEESDVLTEAALLRRLLAIREEVVKKNRGNEEVRNLIIPLDNLGAWRHARGEESDVLTEAALLRRSLAIAEDLAKNDGGNAEWQRDLSATMSLLRQLLGDTNEGEDHDES